MGDFELKAKISLIPIFAHKHLHPSNENYYKVLLTNHSQIISEPIKFVGSLDNQLEALYNKYIAISFDWPAKTLSDCRKTNNEIEITYCVKMPMIEGCVKMGKLINFKDFFDLQMEEYYGRTISRTN